MPYSLVSQDHLCTQYCACTENFAKHEVRNHLAKLRAKCSQSEPSRSVREALHKFTQPSGSVHEVDEDFAEFSVHSIAIVRGFLADLKILTAKLKSHRHISRLYSTYKIIH